MDGAADVVLDELDVLVEVEEVHESPSPSKPALQRHKNVPLRLRQSASGWQGFASHSSTSEHAFPSPSHPALQMQKNESSVSTHSASTLQGVTPDAGVHSATGSHS